MKLIAYSIDVAFHYNIFPSRVRARGSKVKTIGYGIPY
jgi:hypothetical protein